MTTYEIIEELCNKEGIAVTALETELGFGRGSIGKLKNGGGITATRLKMIADRFKVPVDYLLNGGQKEMKIIPTNYDVAKELTETLDHLSSDNALMFNGLELNDETRRLLKSSLQIVIENALMTSEANKKG